MFRPALEPTHFLVQWVPGGSFPEGKARPGRDADNSLPFFDEFKKN
jgi:hypothetical protein